MLRVLGRATCFDGITELSGIAVPTMAAFFHRFTTWFRTEIFPKFVYTPSDKDELVGVEAAYAAVGLPGAIGSMDVVHVAWAMCPAGLAHLATGKEGYPSVAYNVICDHEGRALAVLAGAYGATNDKNIVRFDDFVADVRSDAFFTEYEFEVFVGEGDVGPVRGRSRGAWLIVDPGYHQWEATQAASKVTTASDYAEWRARMESVRKDIECFFGRMKSRFRVLKTPMSFHKKVHVDNTFFTCVALQNILHDWDKVANNLTTWEVTMEWNTSFGNFADEPGESEEARHWCRPTLLRTKKKGGVFKVSATDDFSECGLSSFPVNVQRVIGQGDQKPDTPGEKERYHQKQALLVKHFSLASKHWLLS